MINEKKEKKTYSKTCVKPPLSKRPKIGFQDQLSLNICQKYCRMLQGEHSAILLTFIKLPFVIKIFGLSIFIPRHTLVSGYYVIPFGVCPSVRPCSPFPIDNLSIYSRNFFKFCIHINGVEWYGIVNGQNPSIFNGVTALFCIGKMVSGLLFLYYS